VTGCGVISGRHNEFTVITDKEDAGKVVVVRISSIFGAANGWQIAIDGKDFFGIGSGEYTEFLLPEGEHYISLRCSQPALEPGCLIPIPAEIPHEETLQFVANVSQTIYFIASPSWNCGKIRLSNEGEAKKHIERSKFINLENLATQ
jgi:hypothetical protein